MADSPAFAQADFYNCTNDRGATVFSDKPCGADADKQTVGHAVETGERPNDSAAWATISADKKTRDIERDQKLAVLKNIKRYANNNLAGAQWEQSISAEMQAVTDQYTAKIDAKKREIERLEERIADLRNDEQ
ncbi:MAG: DUF4124 domain-containing protein [Pseudomonadota bacterium]